MRETNMKPYYEQDGITLYHGDCREGLPFMTLPVDVLITDPPYRSLDIDVIRGTTTRLVGGKNSRAGDRVGSGGDWFATLSDEEIAELLAMACAKVIDTGAAYIFADVKTAFTLFPLLPLPVRNVIVWDKMKIGMGYGWRRMHEWIGYCPRENHKLRDMGYGDIIRCPGINDKIHPTEKPVHVSAKLIHNSTDEGGLVLDIFAGVGSTLVAAKELGRRAIGFEIDERHCESAARRLQQGVLFGVA